MTKTNIELFDLKREYCILACIDGTFYNFLFWGKISKIIILKCAGKARENLEGEKNFKCTGEVTENFEKKNCLSVKEK